MSTVDALQKKYPDLARELLVKWEVVRNGVKDTEGLDKVSAWARAGFGYQTYDFDVTLQELVEKEKKEGKHKPGFVKRPRTFVLKNGLIVHLRRHTKSPYEIKALDDGTFAVYEGDEKVEQIYFVNPPEVFAEEPMTSRGTPVKSLINWNGRGCFGVSPVRFCEYFNTGEECKFCNFNATQEDARSAGIYRPVTVNLEETLEAYKILASNVRLVEGRFEAGGFRSDEKETDNYVRFIERIASATTYSPNLTIHAQPMGRKEMQRLKDAGLSSPAIHMEVWDERLFPEVCPGKAKHRGRERYLEAFNELVDVFGAGSVGSCFVAGATLLPENGHTTWQESRDSMVEGMDWMIAHGVMPITTNLRLQEGSIYGNDPANQSKYPPTEYYLDVGLGHHKAMQEYGLYEKLNKLLWCPFDCLGGFYGGEIGMLEQAEDVGTWVNDAIPDGQNWLAEFTSSLKTQPQATAAS